MATKNESKSKTTTTNSANAQEGKVVEQSAVPHSEKTNTLAIIALIVSILLIIGLPLLGLILGIIALSQIKKTGEQGRGLAIASIIISIIGIIITVIAATFIWGSVLFVKKAAKENGININNGSINLNKDGNSVSIGDAKLPSGFPSDVPIYPGSKIVLSSKTNEGSYSVSLTTSDSKSKVDSYYQSELTGKGWVTSDGNAIDFGTFSGTTLTKGDNKLGLITSTNENKKETLINITVEKQ